MAEADKIRICKNPHCAKIGADEDVYCRHCGDELTAFSSEYATQLGFMRLRNLLDEANELARKLEERFCDPASGCRKPEAS